MATKIEFHPIIYISDMYYTRHTKLNIENGSVSSNCFLSLQSIFIDILIHDIFTDIKKYETNQKKKQILDQYISDFYKILHTIFFSSIQFNISESMKNIMKVRFNKFYCNNQSYKNILINFWKSYNYTNDQINQNINIIQHIYKSMFSFNRHDRINLIHTNINEILHISNDIPIPVVIQSDNDYADHWFVFYKHKLYSSYGISYLIDTSKDDTDDNLGSLFSPLHSIEMNLDMIHTWNVFINSLRDTSMNPSIFKESYKKIFFNNVQITECNRLLQDTHYIHNKLEPILDNLYNDRFNLNIEVLLYKSNNIHLYNKMKDITQQIIHPHYLSIFQPKHNTTPYVS